MTIAQFGLTAEQKLKRLEGIGGSDANIIGSGDPARIQGLWEEKTGQVEPENLDDVLPVQMGNATEDFNRFWFTKRTGKPIIRAGEHVTSTRVPFMMCHLDGMVLDCPDPIPAGASAYLDCKHVNQYSKLDSVVQRYMPQMHHNAHIMGVDWAILSVFIGTMNYEWVPITICPFFTATLIEAERYFWNCVETMTPPGEIKIEAAPVAPLPSQMRKVEMQGHNEWASSAVDWLKNKAAAKKFEDATDSIKSLVEFDVGEAFGHGIQVKRSKAGALTIREMKQ